MIRDQEKRKRKEHVIRDLDTQLFGVILPEELPSQDNWNLFVDRHRTTIEFFASKQGVAMEDVEDVTGLGIYTTENLDEGLIPLVVDIINEEENVKLAYETDNEGNEAVGVHPVLLYPWEIATYSWDTDERNRNSTLTPWELGLLVNKYFGIIYGQNFEVGEVDLHYFD